MCDFWPIVPPPSETTEPKFQILAAYDGSDESGRAVEYACELGAAMNASVTAVHAVQPNVYEAASGETVTPSNFSDKYRREILRTIDAAEEQGQEYLAEAERIISDNGLDGSTELLYGDPVNKILEYIDRQDIDTIVVGHKGQSERSGTSIGSVAQTLVERSPVPVIVTR